MNPTVFHRLLYMLIMSGAVGRIVVCLWWNPCDYLFSDPKRHWLNGGRFLAPDLMGASDPILYQFYIFVLRAVSADNRVVIGLASAGLSVITPWLFYRASRELEFNKTEALCIWALLSWIPSLVSIFHFTMMETLLLPMLGLSLWVTGRALRKRVSTALMIAVLTWTLAVMTKPTVAPFGLVCLAWAWWQQPKRVLNAGLALLIVTLLLIPGGVRSFQALGFPAPLGNTWITKIQHRSGDKRIHINFGTKQWVFSSPSCYVLPLSPLSNWAMTRFWQDSTVTITIDRSNGKNDWVASYQKLDVEISEWLTQFGENLVLLLFAPSWPDSNRQEPVGWLNYMFRWLWAPHIFFVLDCNFREFLKKRFDMLSVAVTVFTLFLAFQNVATNEGRYRKPLEPLLLMNLVWILRKPPRLS